MIAHLRDPTSDWHLVCYRMMNLQGQGIIRLLQFSGALSSDNRNVSNLTCGFGKRVSRIMVRNSASFSGNHL